MVVLLMATSLATFAATKKKAKKTAAATNEIVSVKVHRTACFGRCPEYKIEINTSGVATYTAVRFNTDSGIYRKTIGSKKTMAVINEFQKYRVDTCSDMYENRIPDVPGIVFTIKYKNKTKLQVIQNAHFGPQFLKDLAQQMDQVGKKSDNSWKRLSRNPDAVVK